MMMVMMMMIIIIIIIIIMVERYLLRNVNYLKMESFFTMGVFGFKKNTRFFPVPHPPKPNSVTMRIKSIIIISNLSNDRSKASSKTIPPHSAI